MNVIKEAEQLNYTQLTVNAKILSSGSHHTQNPFSTNALRISPFVCSNVCL